MLVAAVLVGGCSSTEPDESIPAGLAATVDGAPFRAGIVLADAVEPGVVVVSGSVVPDRGTLSDYRSVTLFVPAVAGTYTTSDDRAGAAYSVSMLGDSTFTQQTWSTAGPGATLDLRVEAADAAHVEGTFSFTAVGDGDAPGVVRVTAGTFNVGIGSRGRSSVPVPYPLRQ